MSIFESLMSIFQSTLVCYEAYTNYVATGYATEGSIAQQTQSRFDLWKKYSGACARAGFRLDDRLLGFPKIVDVFSSLLKVISQNLDEGESLELLWVRNEETNGFS